MKGVSDNEKNSFDERICLRILNGGSLGNNSV